MKKIFETARNKAMEQYYKPKKKKRMATKTRDPIKEQRKLVTTAVKKTVVTNSVLPILEDVWLNGKELIATDLETYVITKFDAPGLNVCIPANKFLDVIGMMGEPQFVQDKNFGIEITEGKRKVNLLGDNPDQFPKLPEGKPHQIGTFREKELHSLQTALSYVSNDDLRPAMTGIFIGKYLAATDAHRLYFTKLDFKQEFILPKKAVKLLLALGGEEWKVLYTTTHVYFHREGTTIITRIIDARFPDFKVVVPNSKDRRALMTVDRDTLLTEVNYASKFSNMATHQVLFSLNGEITINAQDVDFSFEYNNVVENAAVEYNPNCDKEYRIMDSSKVQKENNHDHNYTTEVVRIEEQISETIVKVKDVGNYYKWTTEKSNLEELPLAFNVGFNAKFLAEMLARQPEGNVKIELWGPTKCGVINGEFLLMPLMLNQ